MSDVAIVGIDCRFAGASNPAELWQMLTRGEDSVSGMPEQRGRADAFLPSGSGLVNTREASFIDRAEVFDHPFFGIAPRDAHAMDPQQRIALQCAWRALEDATFDPRSLAGSRTGVFVGVMGNEWAHVHLTDYARIGPQHGTGNGYCMIANRISYQLDLRGPSMAIDTACSSSLVATLNACNALRAGDCERAIVVGVNVIVTPALNIFYTQAGLSAPDGRCRPFSRDANGIGRGEGVGAIVLMRTVDAERDGFPIYAVIKGGAVNQDGRSNGITAPSRTAQRDVLLQAYRNAGVTPDALAFVEAHGTGTILGDMIEANALGDVHGVPRSRACLVGSIKGNVGHTEGAAGVAGLIKAALALHRGVLPPSRHATTENTQLQLATKGLRLAKGPERLEGGVCLAGVSSFGLGGTNAHAVLASAPREPRRTAQSCPGVLTVSAPDRDSLVRQARLLAADLAESQPTWFGQLAWNSNMTKASGRRRFSMVARDRSDALARLGVALADAELFDSLSGAAGPCVTGWLMTGQGSQYPRMSRALYSTSAMYREALREVDVSMARSLGCSVIELLSVDESTLRNTAYAQPAVFAVGYALGRTLRAAGLEPTWMLGHSIGEYVAATLAGVLSLDDAGFLICSRGRLMGELPVGGAMLALPLSREEVEEAIADESGVDIAAINGERRVVIAGDRVALERINERIAARPGSPGAVRTKAGVWLDVSHAFHSRHMEPMMERFQRCAETVSYNSPATQIFSSLYGRVLREGERMDASYWVRHVREPVNFYGAAREAMRTRVQRTIEVGSRRVLTSLWAQATGSDAASTLAPCPGPNATGMELLELCAELHRRGAAIRWDALYEEGQRIRRRLSPYAFSQDYRSWLQGGRRVSARGVDECASAIVPPSEPDTVAPVARTQQAESDATDVAAAVVDIIAELGGYPREQIRDDARLYEDLGYDSIIALQLKERIERRWSVALETEDLFAELQVVGDLIAIVNSRLRERELELRHDL